MIFGGVSNAIECDLRHIKIVAEIKEEGARTDTEKLVDVLKSKFQSVLFVKVDEIELVPFGTLQMGEHKDKTVVDLRKNKE